MNEPEQAPTSSASVQVTGTYRATDPYPRPKARADGKVECYRIHAGIVETAVADSWESAQSWWREVM